jgi:hypothetical protein
MNEQTVKELDSISDEMQNLIGEVYDLWVLGNMTRQDYIIFLSLYAKMFKEEAEGHQAVLDSEIKKDLDTSS